MQQTFSRNRAHPLEQVGLVVQVDEQDLALPPRPAQPGGHLGERGGQAALVAHGDGGQRRVAAQRLGVPAQSQVSPTRLSGTPHPTTCTEQHKMHANWTL